MGAKQFRRYGKGEVVRHEHRLGSAFQEALEVNRIEVWNGSAGEALAISEGD